MWWWPFLINTHAVVVLLHRHFMHGMYSVWWGWARQVWRVVCPVQIGIEKYSYPLFYGVTTPN
jgi:hypothetical protein